VSDARQDASGERTVAMAIGTERRLLARELHDGPAQSLWSLGAEIQQLEARVGRDAPSLQPQVQALRTFWAQVYDELRHVIAQLHESLPPNAALVPALERDLARLERDCGLKTALELDPQWASGLLDAAREAQLVRVCQAALANVRRHAAARQVTVALRLEDEAVALHIADDGVGFDPASASDDERLGLTSMRERVAQLGGRLVVDSRPGRGTQVRVWVPLRPPDR
jgi:two-component system sensor histidine kinase DegS